MRPNSTVKARTFEPSSPTNVKVPQSASRKKPSLSSCILIEDQKAKKHVTENTAIQFSKFELEKKMKSFIEVLFNKKPFLKNSPTVCFNELKSAIFSSLQEEQKPLSVNVRIDNIDNINKENGNASGPQESELQKRIQELEESQILYEEKINNHAAYTLELEQKVGLLIDEYEKTLAMNEKLNNEIQVLKQEDSILRDSEKHSERHLDSFSEVEELVLKNTQLHNELTITQEEISSLQEKLSKSQGLEKLNIDLNEEVEALRARLEKALEESQQKETFMKDFDLIEDLRHENELLKDELMAKSDLIQCYQYNQVSLTNKLESVQQEQKEPSENLEKEESMAKSAIEAIQKELEENKTISENLQKDLECQQSANENLEKETKDYKEQIEALTATIKKANEDLDFVAEQNKSLEEELSSKDRLKTLVKSLLEKIEALETKAGNLLQENMRLQANKENNLQLISNLKTEAEERNAQFVSICLEDSKDRSFDQRQDSIILFQAKDCNSSSIEGAKECEDPVGKALEVKETEFEQERANHKLQIEQYNFSLQQLIGKIQTLVKINENLGKDFEYLKYEFKSYRTLVWSVFHEIKRRLDNVKNHDDQVEHYFAKSPGDDVQNFNFLLDYYYLIRREAISIDFLLEERRSSI